MPDGMAVSLGVLFGLLVVGAALAWAMWPRRPGRKSRLAAPSDPGLQYEETYVPPHDAAP